MNFTNSDLASYKNLSKHTYGQRTHEIDTITIHCFVGQVTAKQGCDYFALVPKACSANYVVGHDGSIGISVEEKNAAQTSSNFQNDNRAITIEVACDKKAPYAITKEAYSALIKLCADICIRNNIPELRWLANPEYIGQPDKQNMTVHRWFAAKECPGQYIYERLSDIAAQVNIILNSINKSQTSNQENTGKYYRVQAGAFKVKENAERLVEKLNKEGYDAFIIEEQ